MQQGGALLAREAPAGASARTLPARMPRAAGLSHAHVHVRAQGTEVKAVTYSNMQACRCLSWCHVPSAACLSGRWRTDAGAPRTRAGERTVCDRTMGRLCHHRYLTQAASGRFDRALINEKISIHLCVARELPCTIARSPIKTRSIKTHAPTSASRRQIRSSSLAAVCRTRAPGFARRRAARHTTTTDTERQT